MKNYATNSKMPQCFSTDMLFHLSSSLVAEYLSKVRFKKIIHGLFLKAHRTFLMLFFPAELRQNLFHFP